MRTTRLSALGVAVALWPAAVASPAPPPAPQRLIHHAVAEAAVVLADPDRHATGLEDLDLVESLGDCRDAVQARIEAWLQATALVAASMRTSDRSVTATVELEGPVQGVLYVDYQFLRARRRAVLDITFLAPARLTVLQRQQLVTTYGLVALKRDLVREMKCARP